MNARKWFSKHSAKLGGLEILKYIGPGFIVTVGFIDPVNWAANIAAGSAHGYSLLWMVSLSTIMLIILQHNAAHLGIVAGLCLSEASSKFFYKRVSGFFLLTAVWQLFLQHCRDTRAAIRLNMLYGLPLNSEITCYTHRTHDHHQELFKHALQF